MRSPSTVGALEDALFLEHLQHGERRRAGDRVAGIGAAEPAGPAGVHDLRAPDHGREREAARDRLRERVEVRRDAVVLHGEHAAGASGAALDLVRDEQDSMAVAQLAQAHHEFLRRDVEAAFALNRLDDDGRDAIGGDVALEDLRERPEGVVHRHAVQREFGNGAW